VPLTFRTLTLSLPSPPQTEHNSESYCSAAENLRPICHRDDFVVTRGGKLDLRPLLADHKKNVRHYPLDRSYLEPNGFVRVVNENTPEYEDFKPLCDKVDLKALAQSLYAGLDESSHRGNRPFHLGYSGGQNTLRTTDSIANDFGIAIPQIDKGTKEYGWLFDIMSDIARKFGIAYSDDASFLRATRNDRISLLRQKRRQKRFASRLSPSGNNVFEAITIGFVDLSDSDSKVSRHKDHLNDTNLTETMVFKGIVTLDCGRVLCVSIICYLRHSCDMALLRRDAAEETYNLVKSFLDECAISEPHRHPTFDPSEYLTAASGTDGLALIRDSKTGSFWSAAMLTRAASNKQAYFLEAVVQALMELVEARHLCLEEVLEVVYPLVQLNSIFVYVSVLRIIKSETSFQPTERGGFLHLVLELMRRVSGSVHGGPHNRCQPWVGTGGDTLPRARAAQDLQFLLQLCQDSKRSSAGQDPALVDVAVENEKYCLLLKKNIHLVGIFSAQHLVHILARLGLLWPPGLTLYSMSSIDTNNLKKKQSAANVSNPKLLDYLCGGRSGEGGNKQDKIKSNMESTLRYLHFRGYTFITSALL